MKNYLLITPVILSLGLVSGQVKASSTEDLSEEQPQNVITHKIDLNNSKFENFEDYKNKFKTLKQNRKSKKQVQTLKEKLARLKDKKNKVVTFELPNEDPVKPNPNAHESQEELKNKIIKVVSLKRNDSKLKVKKQKTSSKLKKWVTSFSQNLDSMSDSSEGSANTPPFVRQDSTVVTQNELFNSSEFQQYLQSNSQSSKSVIESSEGSANTSPSVISNSTKEKKNSLYMLKYSPDLNRLMPKNSPNSKSMTIVHDIFHNSPNKLL